MENARLGILMLDTRFPRIRGDVGNPDSFDFPVRIHVVDGATPEAIVLDDPRPWIDAFIEAGRHLVAHGCTGLATTCGFLTLLRTELSSACGVPVVASALEQVPGLIANDACPGILTISKASLSQAHLSAAGIGSDVPVEGVDGGLFARSILGNHRTLDTAAARRDMVEAGQRLCSENPEVDAIVLECTNMPPYADAIEQATGRPVYSILTSLQALHKELA